MSNPTHSEMKKYLNSPEAAAVDIENRIENDLNSLISMTCVAACADYSTYSAEVQANYMGACQRLAEGVQADFRALTALLYKLQQEVQV